MGHSQDSLGIQVREKMMKTFTSALVLGILVMLLADSCVGVPACAPDDGVDGMEDTRFGCAPRMAPYSPEEEDWRWGVERISKDRFEIPPWDYDYERISKDRFEIPPWDYDYDDY